MSRLSLDALRARVLDLLDDDWVTPTEMRRMLDVGHGDDWTRVSLVLERLAADGEAELKSAGSRVRRFRRRRSA